MKNTKEVQIRIHNPIEAKLPSDATDVFDRMHRAINVAQKRFDADFTRFIKSEMFDIFRDSCLHLGEKGKLLFLLHAYNIEIFIDFRSFIQRSKVILDELGEEDAWIERDNLEQWVKDFRWAADQLESKVQAFDALIAELEAKGELEVST